MLAAEEGHVAMLHWLLDRGAIIDTAKANTEFTALFIAVLHHRIAAVQALLTRGSNVALADRWGCTPWIMAGVGGHPATFLALFEHLSKTIPREELLGKYHRYGSPQASFLLHQVGSKRVDMVRMLLRLGADPYSDASTNKAWETAAAAAAKGETGGKECLFLLEEWERAYVLAKVRAMADAAGEARAGGGKRGRQPLAWFREGMDVSIDGQEEEEEEKGKEGRVGGVARWVVGMLADDLFRDLTEYVGERTTGLHVEVEEMAEEEVDEDSGDDDDDEAFDW